MRTPLPVLAAFALALGAAPARAQIDQWPWTLFGNVSVGPDSLNFASSTLWDSSAHVDVPGQGTVHFTVTASFQGNPNLTHLAAYKNGNLIFSASDSGPGLHFCSPAPCSSVLGTFAVHVNQGDTLNFSFGDSDEPFPTGAHVNFTSFTLSPDAGFVDLGGGLDGGLLHTWTGGPDSADFGGGVVALDDVNSDGLGDVLVAEPLFDDSGLPNAIGRIDVYSGATGALLWFMKGTPALPYLGTYMDRAGDADGDGLEDVLVGQPLVTVAGQIVGAVEVRRGFDGALIRQYLGTQPMQGFGHGVAGLPDLDLDGTPDLSVGRIWDDAAGTDAGSVIALSGASGGTLFELPGPQADANMGWEMASAGDVDADGVGDLVVGLVNVSAARVYSGAGGALLHEWTAPMDDFFGHAVDGAGDVNGDGHADIVVGAPQDGSTSDGYARVYSGATFLPLFEIAGDGFGESDEMGVSVAGVGDCNGDGLDDVLVGANHDAFSGSARLLAGPAGAPLLKLALEDQQGAQFGSAVSGGFDTDGDGNGDLQVGATNFGPSGFGPGAVFLYSGDPEDHESPTLLGSGTLTAGSHLTLLLAGGPPLGACALVVGLHAYGVPFKGGVFIPYPDLIMALPLDGSGGLALGGVWPTGIPAGTQAWMQGWMPDAGGPKGWTASNGLQLVTP